MQKQDRFNELSAVAMANLIRAGKMRSEIVVEHCLSRMQARDQVVGAWAYVDPESALEQARSRDRCAPTGLLHGVPVGIKDIIDTVDMPTEMGSPIYAGYRPRGDAACVALLRAAGAVILGKTVTAEFAHVAPGRTTNPFDASHTPGGSSSGSAAAVADNMVSLAVGTQTGGSTIRPAAYCGIVGYKPTFGRMNRAGIKPGAESLDTVGLMARSVADIELISRALFDRAAAQPPGPARALRVGLCRTHSWAAAAAETVFAIEDSALRLQACGADVREVSLPERFAHLHATQTLISQYERSRAMAYEWNNHRDLLSKPMQNAIRAGMEIPGNEYLAALKLTRELRGELEASFADLDVLLAPAAHGAAPEGLESTGDTRFQAMWTLLHVPAITLPTHRGPHDLPVGIQLIGRWHDDERLLKVSRLIEERLCVGKTPGDAAALVFH